MLRATFAWSCVAQSLALQGPAERVIPVVPHPPVAAAAGSATSTPKETIATGAHYQLIFHFDVGDMAKGALALAESSWPRAAHMLDAAGEVPPKPMQIHVYGTIADYERAESARTKGYFKKNLSFSDWNTQTAHIALQPPLGATALRELGLPRLTRNLIAHEATHLACYALAPNYRFHPEWFSEGLAVWSAGEALDLDALEREPFESTDIVIVQHLIEKERMPSFEQLLRGDVNRLSTGERYACEGLWFRYLSDRELQPSLITIGREVRRLGGGPGLPGNVQKYVDDVLPLDQRGELEHRFRAFAQKLTPYWEEVYRSLESIEGGYAELSFPEKNAIAWRQASLGGQGFTAHGKLKIFSGQSACQLNFLFGRQPAGFFQIAFQADGGGIDLLHYDAQADAWTTLARGQSDKLGLDRTLELSIEITPSRARVRLDTQTVLDAPLEQSSLAGAWGLGALAGSAGTWTALAVDSIPSAK